MDIIHRYNSKERQHYLLGSHYSFRLRPQLLYVGRLNKQAGWHDEPHSHDFAEILFVKEGCGTVRAYGTEKIIGPGDIIVYNAGISHEETSNAEAPLELIFFALDKVNITDLDYNCLLPEGYDFVYNSLEYYELFCSLTETMLKEMKARERFHLEIAQNISRTLIMYLFRIINSTTNKAIIKSNAGYRAALEYINQHFREPLELEDIAAACYINKFYLSHLFARENDMSIGQYITKRRLDEACYLLKNTNHSVNKISELSGFNDFSYFCRCFKKNMGITPTQYRKSQQK